MTKEEFEILPASISATGPPNFVPEGHFHPGAGGYINPR